MQSKAESALATAEAAYAAAVERVAERLADHEIAAKTLASAGETYNALLTDAIERGDSVAELLGHRSESARREEEVVLAKGILEAAERRRQKIEIELFAAKRDVITERIARLAKERVRIAEDFDAKVAEARKLLDRLHSTGDGLDAARRDAQRHYEALEYVVRHGNAVMAEMNPSEWPKVRGAEMPLAEKYELVLERARFQQAKNGFASNSVDLRRPLAQHEASILGLPIPVAEPTEG